ncbi:YopX family protein [Paenibacillus odorifer]|uniref:YopX family protein n=1 Tax=Paenibacillus TaxID=44249 RepID=UPI0009701180|nr:YopX family protein [Paenibacillus odorifer]OMD00885.1 hypothetical protein BJP46_18830 [Paenibacillus odorifer]
MGREIKFRGKRIDNSEWIEGYYAYRHDEEKHYIVVETVSTQGYNTYFTDYEVDPNTVGQYTGLNDKNGRKICEGDIIRWHERVTADYQITFTEGVFCLDSNGLNNFYHHREDLVKWEVIGNIYENPELIEV